MIQTKQFGQCKFLADAPRCYTEGSDGISESYLSGNAGTFDRQLLVWGNLRFLLRLRLCIRCHFCVAGHYQCMSLRSRNLYCSLDRFSSGHNSCLFLHTIWRHYSISVTVFTFLTPAEQFRLSWAHIVILVDRAEVALCATAQLLGFYSLLSSYSVPTPPLQAWSAVNHGDESSISTGSEAEMGEFHNFGSEPST